MRPRRLGFKSVFAAAVILCGAIAAAPVEASTISFTSSGTVGGFPVSATADFNFFADFFTITLTNTIDNPHKVPQMLDGLMFTMTGGSQGSTPALTGVPSIGAIVNCTSGTFPCPAGDGSSPYGWGAGTSLGETVLAAGYQPPPGSIAFHDYAIINNSYTAGSLGSGGLGNNGHNPLLIGPVTFGFSGAFTGVTDVSFLWGTDGAPTNGICLTCSTDTHDGDNPPVPEPASMLLFGTGLLGVGAAARRRFFGKQ